MTISFARLMSLTAFLGTKTILPLDKKQERSGGSQDGGSQDQHSLSHKILHYD